MLKEIGLRRNGQKHVRQIFLTNIWKNQSTLDGQSGPILLVHISNVSIMFKENLEVIIIATNQKIGC